jgi:hypothetical protein
MKFEQDTIKSIIQLGKLESSLEIITGIIKYNLPPKGVS